jgi:dTDP-4-dehydrorhamnose reductase
MARLIVTGASGLLGANVVLEASGEHDVVAIYNHHKVDFANVVSKQVDLTSDDRVQRMIEDLCPDAVIHCAAGTGIDDLEGDPTLAMRLNCDMAGSLARAASAHDVRFIHLSTDAVFDGRKGHYSENDRPSPINEYGRSKLAGESAVQRENLQALIVRTNIFGWSPGWKSTLAEWFVKSLEAGADVPGFIDVHFSPILVNDLARILLKLIDHDMQGIVHIPSADCVSKHAFGVLIANALNLNPDRVFESTSDDAQFTAPRPKNTCLLGERVQDHLGIELPSVQEGVRQLFELRASGYVDQLRKSREEADG